MADQPRQDGGPIRRDQEPRADVLPAVGRAGRIPAERPAEDLLFLSVEDDAERRRAGALDAKPAAELVNRPATSIGLVC